MTNRAIHLIASLHIYPTDHAHIIACLLGMACCDCKIHRRVGFWLLKHYHNDSPSIDYVPVCWKKNLEVDDELNNITSSLHKSELLKIFFSLFIKPMWSPTNWGHWFLWCTFFFFLHNSFGTLSLKTDMPAAQHPR